MIGFLMSLFKSDPGKKILKERDRLYAQAVELQRNGDLRSYAEVMSQIEQLEKENKELKQQLEKQELIKVGYKEEISKWNKKYKDLKNQIKNG